MSIRCHSAADQKSKSRKEFRAELRAASATAHKGFGSAVRYNHSKLGRCQKSECCAYQNRGQSFPDFSESAPADPLPRAAEPTELLARSPEYCRDSATALAVDRPRKLQIVTAAKESDPRSCFEARVQGQTKSPRRWKQLWQTKERADPIEPPDVMAIVRRET